MCAYSGRAQNRQTGVLFEVPLTLTENWSLCLELKIIAATPFVEFIHRDAL
jgi:hypothetical protein